MLSTLRQQAVRSSVRLGQHQCTGRGWIAAPFHTRQVPFPWLCARACSSGGENKPPKGFERFANIKKAGEKDDSDAKAETTGKDGNGKTDPVEADSKAGKDTKSGPSEKSKTSSDSSKEGASSGKKGDEPPVDANRQMLVAAIAMMLFFYMSAESSRPPVDEITIQELIKDYLVKGLVDRIQIVNMDHCRVFLRHDAEGPMAGKELRISLGNLEVFEAKIEQVQRDLGIAPLDFVAVQYVNETDFLYDILPHLPTLLVFVAMLVFMRSMMSGAQGGGPGGGLGGGRNMFSIGKAFPAGVKDLKSKVTFKDVAGMAQAKKEVVEFVDFLKAPEKFEGLGAKCPKGGLLVGPPGTGKTLLAKAVAGEAGCPFFSMSGSDFIEMFVGVGPSRVRDLFSQARAQAPSIIFIDEIDAVGRKRGKGGFSGGGNDERENTLNQLLVEMDGFSSGTGVVVLAGTNRADILDDALKRPGRFDRQIAIDKPDLAERKEIFHVHLKPVALSETLPEETVAQRMAALTPGMAGADIANVCNEAAIFAARRSAEAVEMVDFELATERVIGGLPKNGSLMSPEEKRAVALHECGHAIAGWFLEHTDPLLKVSIVPRASGALGFAQYLPDEVRLHSKEAILDRIAMALGGRAAEEIFVGSITTGASDDLNKVTQMAYSMLQVYGMNAKLGLVSFQGNASEQFYKPYSESVAQTMDAEARKLIDEQYVRVKKLLEEKREQMFALANKLEEHETIVYNDIVSVLGERPYGVKEEFRKFATAGVSLYEVPKAEVSEDATENTTESGASSEASSASAPAKEESSPSK